MLISKLISAKIFNQNKIGIHLLISTLVVLILNIYPTRAIALDNRSPQNISSLERKIAKSYSGKFCNAIAMGVSEDGALAMAVAENLDPSFNPGLWLELILSGDKNVKEVEQNNVTNLASTYVIRDCGYPIGLSGEQGHDEFMARLTSKIEELS